MLPPFLIDWVRDLGWLGVFLGVLLETFIAPIPSALVPIGVGILLISSDASFFEVAASCFFIIALAGALGATIGAFFGYGLGYLGGRYLIERYGRFIGVTWREIEKAERKLTESGISEFILFLSRAIPIFPLSPVSIGAGVIRLGVKKFAVWTFLGSVPRYFVLGIAGWIAGTTYKEFAQSIEFVETLMFITIMVVIVVFVCYLRKRRKTLLKRSIEPRA